jgi:hypothetical protein
MFLDVVSAATRLLYGRAAVMLQCRENQPQAPARTNAMPSPFPGMDPYLETQPRWEIFHGWFIHKLAEFALPKAARLGCWIDVERDVYGEDPSGERVLIGEADEVLTVSSGESEWSGNGAATAVLTKPRSIREVVVEEEEAQRHRQHYLVVRENQKWPRALAVVELLSPANKEGTYARTYHAKRSKMLASMTHFMEIDLLRGGDSPLRRHFSDLEPTPYFVFVARKLIGSRHEESYPIRLQDCLPTIGLPLWGERPDLPLDLGEAFHSAYDLTTGGRPIQYKTEAVPGPALATEDEEWAANLVGAMR